LVVFLNSQIIKVADMSDNKNQDLKAFTLRLEMLLEKKGKTLSPTALARDFNLRWRGVPVTVNATRKWLMGQAMPTMDKLAVLANMLNASEDWLRWGAMSVDEPVNQSYDQLVSSNRLELRNAEKSFTQDFKLLNETNKKVVTAVLEVLLNQQQSSAVSAKNQPSKIKMD
jgi:transcriptional regulator with XRE-family HTH domain